MTPEERKEYMKRYKAEHREYRKKYNAEHREEKREYLRKYMKKYRKKYISEHLEEHKARVRKYQSEDLNSNGVPKKDIRLSSRRILDKCHAKLTGYEIHHCFGYEDAEKFIYIPRELHLKIHKLLKDNHISADSDHWNLIRELVNSCGEYTYIRT